ncbi:protein transport protein bet1 [Sparganum proliferum]
MQPDVLAENVVVKVSYCRLISAIIALCMMRPSSGNASTPWIPHEPPGQQTPAAFYAYRNGVNDVGASHRSGATVRMPPDTSLLDTNDKLADELRAKVSNLRALSISIGDEVREHNAFLSGMSEAFERSEGMLKAALRRVGIIRRTEGSGFGLYCQLFLFVFLFFFLCWLLLKFAR